MDPVEFADCMNRLRDGIFVNDMELVRTRTNISALILMFQKLGDSYKLITDVLALQKSSIESMLRSRNISFK